MTSATIKATKSSIKTKLYVDAADVDAHVLSTFSVAPSAEATDWYDAPRLPSL